MQILPYRDNQANLLDYIHLCSCCIALHDSDKRKAALPEIQCLRVLIAQQEAATEQSVGLTLPTLRRVFLLGDCDYFCIVFALACELDGSLRNEVQKLCGSPVPSFDLVFSIYTSFESAELPNLFTMPNPNLSPLRLALRLDAGFAAETPLLAAPLLLRRNVLHFLVCGFAPKSSYYEVESFAELVPLPLHEAAYGAANAYIGNRSADANSLYFFLMGVRGTGKRTLIKRLCAEWKAPCIFLDCNTFVELDKARLEQLSIELAVDLALSGALLCFFHYRCAREELLEIFVRSLPLQGIPLFVLSDEENTPPPRLEGKAALVHFLTALSEQDYSAAWARLSSRYSVEEHLVERVVFYRLTVGQMEQAWALAAQLCVPEGRERVSERELAAAVRRMNTPSDCNTQCKTQVAFSDMVLSEETMARLHLVCDFARQDRTLCAHWGFAQQPHGRGVSALLCGAPGTGKTMAAQAIANELGLELLRLDLSQIIDKYIGETEKKLAAVFEVASRGNYILFFDEADALFSKRTEIASSHDRYANVETSFLLQSIEQYDGIVLLATNLFKNFDDAFLRRINIIVRFSQPDEALRLMLWESAFPAQTPLAPELDFALLSRELELSPAAIKSAARCAAVQAAAANASVSIRHLLFGLRNELEKYGQEARLTTLVHLLEQDADDAIAQNEGKRF